ncbi:formin-binding protein 1-like isoform X4 [Ischnura elegans]|uniref:formin-binding protein 1-like isoform X4 n=1 Tax=Ischnura elegans TaxID=197161 RepID=UPI001ED882A1|nr:formin-binding protein 1-like isoform X4 [Ischnura elegans]
MSWGIELWDQYDNIAAHTQKGIDFLEKYGHFIRDRCAIEMDYAGKLRRLVKNYQPKKKDEEDYQYSTCRAFRAAMTEINDLAGQHEVVAENLQAQVIQEINVLVKYCKEGRKKHLQEGSRMTNSLAAQIAALERSKRAYEKSFKEAERALEAFQKADLDFNLSRAEVEKQRTNMTIKQQLSDEARTDYAHLLQRTNEMQTQHYQVLMPDIFRQLQELDEKRVKNIRNFMIKTVDIERQVAPIISKCLDGIVRSADEINEKEDTNLVIERYKSGFSPPGDFPFEDLSALRNGDGNGIGVGIGGVGGTGVGGPGGVDGTLAPQSSATLSGHLQHHPLYHKTDSATVKGTISAGKLKKRVGLFGIFGSNKNNLSTLGEAKEDFGDLPPNQRKKKIQQRIDEIAAKVQQETAARDALMKMKGVYESNPAMGDPMSVEGQLHESGNRLDKLRLELQKYQGYLADLEGIQVPVGANGSNGSPRLMGAQPGPAAPSLPNQRKNQGQPGPHSPALNGHSGSEDSLSRSASDSSVSNPAAMHSGVGKNAASSAASLQHHLSQANKQSAPGTPLPSHGSSNSPESGLGTSHTSLPGSEGEDRLGGNNGGEYYYDGTDNGIEEVLPPLGTCRALYPFEATSEGSIPMGEGEELWVVELDQGDGWTRVRRQGPSNIGGGGRRRSRGRRRHNGGNDDDDDEFDDDDDDEEDEREEEGFVPTSYIVTTLFPEHQQSQQPPVPPPMP